MSTNRRHALQSLSLGGLAALSCQFPVQSAISTKKLPVAAIVTAYTQNSHADAIIGKILNGWRQDGGEGPNLKLASLYVDQIGSKDLSRDLAKQHGFRVANTIDEVVTHQQDDISVAGVISIGEHGNYPENDAKQKMYPRRRFFDEAVAAMRRRGDFVPFFNDKHLSWNWRDAKHMYDVAVRYDIPLMAGSSLPVTWRYPSKELPIGIEIEDAVMVGYGGLEAYGFHAIEGLQCVMERRNGGESGVASVQALSGDQIWQAERDGKWDRRLVKSAVTAFGGSGEKLEEKLSPKGAAFYLVEYRDGLRTTVAMLNGVVGQFAIACRIRSRADPFVCWFRLELKRPWGHFAWLLKGIEHMIHSRQPAYPVERTLLTTGILDRAMRSLQQHGKRLLTPDLGIRYSPSSWGFANREEENFPD